MDVRRLLLRRLDLLALFFRLAVDDFLHVLRALLFGAHVIEGRGHLRRFGHRLGRLGGAGAQRQRAEEHQHQHRLHVKVSGGFDESSVLPSLGLGKPTLADDDARRRRRL
jgi:hypothetical protein